MITADHVARAVVAAARETGADPVAVASGENPSAKTQDYSVSRARAYAATALATIFTSVPNMRIARLCGVSKAYAQVYFNTLRTNRRGNATTWWRDDVLSRVIDAVGVKPSADVKNWNAAVSKKPAAQEVEKIDAPRGTIKSRMDRYADRERPANLAGGEIQLQGRIREQRECRDLLAEAAANTAKLQAKLEPKPGDD